MPEETDNKGNPVDVDSSETALKERILELEKTLADRNTELSTARKSVEELQEKLTAKDAGLNEAVTSYRSLVLQTNPEITEELVTGTNIAAINESLAKAKSLIGKVRQSVEKDISRTRIPIGSPGRQAPDLSTLSPREKIHYAIGGKK